MATGQDVSINVVIFSCAKITHTTRQPTFSLNIGLWLSIYKDIIGLAIIKMKGLKYKGPPQFTPSSFGLAI